ncbi:GGDEF domain-containing protein [Serratia quinivorans]|uniref:GGDEF domain-containing protein n=1 Tax=Serratia quinivorans TaxID=137545 RepID=UPI00217B7DC1|nr:GGDEF domain-containing protein [Serratia quinivorans]CAI0719053.1 Probable diguanylate cyclase AdrA [Serratia quinivorans]CAI0720348.1 Probable diguanylate cyclase AdrA [Serratia quinivorans]CAI0746546.1 Probable diguanylate cyclase AdrA [Serratia quinivorans]CAI1656078.1 Probable diguanylate cyclase AdrA [Serratia quinivorans]CAI2048060.1 Probable diguanylate cyclase AdrA [Serratia quinivorans]
MRSRSPILTPKKPALLNWLLQSAHQADNAQFQRQMRFTLVPSPATPWLNAAGVALLLLAYGWLSNMAIAAALLALLISLTAGRWWLARTTPPLRPTAMLVMVLLWCSLVGATALLAMLSGRMLLILSAGLLITALAFWLMQRHAAAPRFALLEVMLLTLPYLLAAPLSRVQNLFLLADIIPLWLLLAYGLIAFYHQQVVQHVTLTAEKQQVAHQDHLTGFLNRAGGEAVMQDICRPSPAQHPLSHLFIIEFTPLAALYQSHGVLIGDDVLRTIGERLKMLVRPSDFVCRYSGGQFLILVHGLPYGSEGEFLARIVPPLEVPYDFGAFGEVTLRLNSGVLALTQDYKTVASLMTAAQQALGIKGKE